MNNPLTTKIRAAKRLFCLALALFMIVAVSPVFLPHSAFAAQMDNRSIELSDSGPSGTSITTGVGSGTNVTYKVSFDATAAAESVVIDFCNDSPLIGSTCTAPTGFDASSATYTAVTGQVTVAHNWSITPSTSHIALNNTGTSGDDIAAGTQSFELKGITNPSSFDCNAAHAGALACSFYARIYTFANHTNGTYSSATSPGNYVDFWWYSHVDSKCH